MAVGFNQSEIDLLTDIMNDNFDGNQDVLDKLKNRIVELISQLVPLVNWTSILMPMRISIACYGYPSMIDITTPNNSVYRITLGHLQDANNIKYICLLHDRMYHNDPVYKSFKNDLIDTSIDIDNTKFKGIPPRNYTIYVKYDEHLPMCYDGNGVINSEYPEDMEYSLPKIITYFDNDMAKENAIILGNYNEFSECDNLMVVKSNLLDSDECVVIDNSFEYAPLNRAYLFDMKNKICYIEYVKLKGVKYCYFDVKICKMYQDGDTIRYLYEDVISDFITHDIYIAPNGCRDSLLCEHEFEEHKLSVTKLMSELYNIKKCVEQHFAKTFKDI